MAQASAPPRDAATGDRLAPAPAEARTTVAPEPQPRLTPAGCDRPPDLRSWILPEDEDSLSTTACDPVDRVVPVYQDGRPEGFKLFGFKAGDGFFGRVLALEPGDVVLAVNGVPMDMPDHVLEAYAPLSRERVFDVCLRRQGRMRLHRYVRDRIAETARATNIRP